MRTLKQIHDELSAMESYIGGLNKEELKDIQVLSETLIELAQQLARSAVLCAEATYLYNTAKKRAYLNYIASAAAQDKYMGSVSLIKDFIAAKFAQEAALEVMADRVNKSLTHTGEWLRSILSAAKTEFATLAYARS
jgi:hypothetical protein